MCVCMRPCKHHPTKTQTLPSAQKVPWCCSPRPFSDLDNSPVFKSHLLIPTQPRWFSSAVTCSGQLLQSRSFKPPVSTTATLSSPARAPRSSDPTDHRCLARRVPRPSTLRALVSPTSRLPGASRFFCKKPSVLPVRPLLLRTFAHCF